ncbi:Crp/Fnr family transcriptional regulator [Treponema sp. C6A8]|uniref:Crp/Fnr family transcriptional regulator n=1 Tax=Treponema sp. C6A8 TaxID=1410609 RepID=UPI000481C755|nr:Crp/Fnr family transcriptional regulator [Treponema sp. C6A8]
MPKAIRYTADSIIYFAGNQDYRIFILQNGVVNLSSTDIETGNEVNEKVKAGEFFGVKSALGKFAREETARAVTPVVIIALTVQEFENIFVNNKDLILKMLRVFSGQLRQVHKKTESALNNVSTDLQSGLLSLGTSFFADEQYRSAADVYLKFLKRYPNSIHKDEIMRQYQEAKLKADRLAALNKSDINFEEDDMDSSNRLFALPAAFERFAKVYEPGQVIIAEFEPGDSFYLIQKGKVQLIKCVNGSKKNLDILKPGELFGEMAILDNSPRSATCMAIGKVKCLEFNKENFQLLITGNPQIALHLLKLFCKRINDQKRRFRILCIKDYQARISDVFLLLDEMNPTSKENEKQRRFNVTINDVANWAGLPAEVTKDELFKLAAQRKVEIYDDYMIVSNINEMKRLYEARSLSGSL